MRSLTRDICPSALVIGAMFLALASHDASLAPGANEFEVPRDLATAACRHSISQFIDMVGARRIDEALEILNKATHGRMSEQQLRTTRQFLQGLEAFKDYDGHAICGVRLVTDRLQKLEVLSYHSMGPILYHFYLIQFQGEWIVALVGVESDLNRFVDSFPRERGE